MTDIGRRALLWTPRIISMLYIAYLSIFSLDAFSPGQSFWQNLGAFAVELIPCFVLIAILVFAWHREWIGAVGYGAAGLLHILLVLPRSASPVLKFTWITVIAGPAFVVAAFFLANWLKRSELHATPPKHGLGTV